MTLEEEEECFIVDKATAETHKFAQPVESGYLQTALERLLMSERVRLIDVARIAATDWVLTRIFVVTPKGLAWREKMRKGKA